MFQHFKNCLAFVTFVRFYGCPILTLDVRIEEEEYLRHKFLDHVPDHGSHLCAERAMALHHLLHVSSHCRPVRHLRNCHISVTSGFKREPETFVVVFGTLFPHY